MADLMESGCMVMVVEPQDSVPPVSVICSLSLHLTSSTRGNFLASVAILKKKNVHVCHNINILPHS